MFTLIEMSHSNISSALVDPS